MPLIDANDAWTLWAVILSCVALSIYLEQRFVWAAKLSGPVIAILIAMILSNARIDKGAQALGLQARFERIMPTEAATYDVVKSYIVPVAVVLLLFRANVRAVFSSSRTMLLAFHLAAVGSLVGTVIAALVYRGRFAQIPEVSGMMAASYIGGGVNFVAVQQTYQVGSNLAGPLLVADNLVMAGFFLILLSIAESKFFRRRYPHPHSLEAAGKDSRALAAEHWRPKPISLLDIAKALGVAVAIAAVAAKLASKIGAAGAQDQGHVASVWEAALRSLGSSPYVHITILSVAVATLFPKAVGAIAGAEELGGYLLYVFLFVIGLPADMWKVLGEVPELFGFCLIISVANLAVALLAGKVLGLNLEELLLASNATLGGPPSAAAMAISKGWSRLVLPGVLAGVWGYVIGTPIGILVVEWFRRML